MGIMDGLAGLGGRRTRVGFTALLATAIGRREPGSGAMGITHRLAGLGERMDELGITSDMALAIGIGEPGIN